MSATCSAVCEAACCMPFAVGDTQRLLPLHARTRPLRPVSAPGMLYMGLLVGSLCAIRSCCGIAAYAFDHRGPLVHFRKLCLNLHAAIFAITVLTDLRVVASAGKPRLVSAPCNHVACIHRQVLTASPVARVRWPGADGMPDSSLSPPLAPVYSFTRFQLVPAQHRQHG